MYSEELARKIRINAVNMVHKAKASHIGGALSCADIVAVLYSDVLKFFPNEPKHPERDRFVLSKGHNGVILYAVLAESGFYEIEKLKQYGTNGSPFSCHISHKKVPGVEISTGSLGQGVCTASGMALSAKIRKSRCNVYTIIGDGECNEGSVWEMAMFAYQYKLDNFTVIVDKNNMQAMGKCKEVMDMESLSAKWSAFGWTVVNVEDGHNHEMLKRAFAEPHNGKPKVIIANTIKGKGVSFMENNIIWHYRDPQGEDYTNAIKELDDLL